ncbi:MAG: tyrosine-type recombinase/integrase, partial [Vicinamibacterales bacterium]
MGSITRQKGRKNFLIRYYRNGIQMVESAHTDDKTEAKNLLRIREGDISRGLPMTSKVGRLRFEEAAADVVNEYKMNGRRSVDELDRRITKHLHPFFGGRRMSAITAADVRAYVTARQADTTIVIRAHNVVRKDGTIRRVPERRRPIAAGPSNAEINRELTALKRAFSLAVEGGKLLHQPHIPMLEENNVRTGFFEREAFEAVCRHLPAELAAVMRFAYETGWRIDSEVLPLDWRRVDFTERLSPSQMLPGTVRLDAGTTKNGEGRVFPFTEALKAVLASQHAEHLRLKKAGQIEPWVFFRMTATGRGGARQPKPIRRFAKAWSAACIAAGCPGRIPHDLRRTAVR